MKSSLSKLNPKDFSQEVLGKETRLFVLKNSSGMEVSLTNFGGRIVEIFAPDRHGNFADVALGHNTLDEYVNFKAARFYGAAVGRYANRIANAQFSIGEKTYKLEANNGTASLHGGSKGFDMLVWNIEDFSENEVRLSLESPDGDGGYGGNLRVDMLYALRGDNSLEIEYTAKCDAPTHVNLTNHSFFNLRGEGEGDINGHILSINADNFTPVDSSLIPTGEIRSVEGTPLDFRQATRIGERLDSDYSQMKIAGGYDHNWVLNKSTFGAFEEVATVYEENSGRLMRMFTTEPALQFFGGAAFKSAENGKCGKPYVKYAGLALEAQHYPDSPNKPEFPTTLLMPDGVYKQCTAYKFEVR